MKGLKWDPHFQCLFSEVPQSKVSDVKIVAFVTGSDRNVCWFTSFGDILVLGDRYDFEEAEASWLLPRLQNTKSPGRAIGSYIRALQPKEKGGSAMYAQYAVPNLPEDANAGGIRPGVCNELCTCMPAEIAAASTGHEMNHISAMYSYVDASLAMNMPGATVLGGFPPPPWGQLCRGPVPASLAAILNLGVNAHDFEVFVDRLFRLDSASPPMLMIGGSIRDGVHVAAASLIMHYEDREKAGEVKRVQAALRNVWAETFGRLVGEVAAMRELAHVTLVQWGKAVRVLFLQENMNIAAARSGANTSNLADSFGQVGRIISEQSRASRDLLAVVSELRVEVAGMRVQIELREQVFCTLNNVIARQDFNWRLTFEGVDIGNSCKFYRQSYHCCICNSKYRFCRCSCDPSWFDRRFCTFGNSCTSSCVGVQRGERLGILSARSKRWTGP